jgi:hypothetical protein
MATGSGLDAQLGIGIETTWGTGVTVDRFYEFVSESLTMEPSWLEPSALRAGTKFKRAGRVRQSRRTVGGDIVLEHATRGMGRLWKAALASPIASPAQIASTTAYEQIHVPGDYRGLGMTVQVGRPEPGTGVNRAFTYRGCKVTAWSLSIRDQEVPQLTLTLDGRDESVVVALASPSYIAGSSVFDFSQASLRLGGTAATASGKTTITGGAAAATIINEITIAGETPMATERFGLGNAGLKAEQLENDIPTITGSFGAEFNRAELYDAFSNNTTQAVEVEVVGAAIGASGHNDRLVISLPACKYKAAAPNVGGPDIVSMSTDFEAYSDEVNPVIQVRLVSNETGL